MTPEALRDRRGERLGGYLLEELLGVGATSSVWLGRGERRAVAIRIDGSPEAPDAEARFARIKLLDHPNLLKVHGAGRTAEGEPYFVCELSEGTPLAEVLSEGQPLPLTVAVPIALRLLDALEHAHRQGLFSLAPEPSGVFLSGPERTEVKLRPTNGGDVTPLAARLAAADAAHALDRRTLAHTAPERSVLGRGAAPADVYAVGAMLFHMLTGRPPHDAPDARSLARDLLLKPAPGLLTALQGGTPAPGVGAAGGVPGLASGPPGALGGGLGGGGLSGVAAVVDRALARRPEARFQTAAAMRRALVGVTGIDLPTPTVELPALPAPAAVEDRPSSPLVEPSPRNPVPYYIAGVLVALVAGGLLVTLFWSGR